MNEAACDDQRASGRRTGRARDLFAVLHIAATSDQHDSTQRWRDLHQAKYNNLDKAHREVFNRIVDEIRNRLAFQLDVSPSDEAASTWRVELSRAVELGRPANFTAGGGGRGNTGYGEIDGDHRGNAERCLKVYAVEKLQARCRQLYHLLFNDDAFASKLRALLITSDDNQHDDNARNGHDTGDTVNVISLGGGPGYDHVALCIAAKFLRDVQPLHIMPKPRCIRTRVYDLFHVDWQPVMAVLQECSENALLLNNEAEGNQYDGGSNMTMHHADVRLGLDETIHADLASAVESAHIICAQFVLHENSSFILVEGEGSSDGQQNLRIGGTIRDIFARAKLGTIMICTDSANTLFPPLKATAAEYGWDFLGDEEQRKMSGKLMNMGPRSYVVLERVK